MLTKAEVIGDYNHKTTFLVTEILQKATSVSSFQIH